MQVKRVFLFISALFLFLGLLISPVRAEQELEYRMELIEASQRLEEEKKVDPYSTQIGIMFTNFGSLNKVANPGVRLENHVTAGNILEVRLLTEGIYLREQSEIAGFLSVMFKPGSPLLPYIGLGTEVFNTANYQLFTGINVTENIFVDFKFINSEGNLWNSNLFLSAGFQVNY